MRTENVHDPSLLSQSLAKCLVHDMGSIKESSIKTKVEVGKHRTGKLYVESKITELLVHEHQSCF